MSRAGCGSPLLAKLAAWAGSREAAIGRLLRALSEYEVSGIRTNIRFFREILRVARITDGKRSNRFPSRRDGKCAARFFRVKACHLVNGEAARRRFHRQHG